MGSTGAIGSTGRSRGASNSPASVSQVKVQNGNTVTLDKPLQYGQKDPSISPVIRAVIEPWEKLREKSKLEHLLMLDNAGKTILEKRGKSGSVSFSLRLSDLRKIEVLTHNHPRGNNLLGGPFSQADIKTFTNKDFTSLKTMRATAAEGTYSITKGANFNNVTFRKDIIREMDKVDSNFNHVRGKAYKEYMSQKITWAEFKAKELDLFNGSLVRMHNLLLANQSKYDYTYTLEPK